MILNQCISSFNSMKDDKHGILIFGIFLMFLMIIFSYNVGTVSASSVDTIYVNGNSGNDLWDGSSSKWAGGTTGPKATIKNATGVVKTDGTVNIANGYYKEGDISISTKMTILGESTGKTIIDGANASQIFHILPGVTVNISNLTLTGGNSKQFGGAVNNEGTLTLKGIKCVENEAEHGGAIYSNGDLIVNNCDFKNNLGTWGGAIDNDGGSLTISTTNFSNNNAAYGGAIYVINGGLTQIYGSTISRNNAYSEGGAVFNGGTITMIGNDLTSNNAILGGAIFNGGTATVNFNRIFGNTATTGSAIYNSMMSLDASLNWWGSNVDPTTNTFGGVTASPWLILTISSNPTAVTNNNNSTITTDLLHDSNGNYHSPIGGHVINGILVTFTSTLGTTNNQSSTLNGIAQSIFKSGSKAGIALLSTTVDSQITKTSVTIKDNIPPKVTAIDPLNKTINVHRTKIIKITFSEAIKYGKNPWIELHQDGKFGVPLTSKIVGNCLYITPQYTQWNMASYTLILHTNSITDLSGNGLKTPFISNYKTRPLLYVSDSNPANRGIVQDLHKTIKINFSGPVTSLNSSEIVFTTKNGTPVKFNANISGSTLNIKPIQTLKKGTTYMITLHNKCVKDSTGSFLDIQYDLMFNTTNNAK